MIDYNLFIAPIILLCIILGVFFGVIYLGNGIIELQNKTIKYCSEKFPYTNSTIEQYNSCRLNPTYYGWGNND